MSTTLPRICWPIVITGGSNDAFKFAARASSEGAGVPTEYTFNVTAATYEYPEELAAAIKAGIDATAFVITHSGTVAITVSSTGRFVFTWGAALNGSTITIYFDSAVRDALGALLGFAVNANSTATVASNTTTITGAFQHRQGWYPAWLPA